MSIKDIYEVNRVMRILFDGFRKLRSNEAIRCLVHVCK